MEDGRVGAARTRLGNKITAEAKFLLKCISCTAEGQLSFNRLGCKHLFWIVKLYLFCFRTAWYALSVSFFSL